MPEIAEVEIIRRGLADLAGALIEHVEIFDPRLESLPVEEVEGSRVVRAVRHGKLLGLALDSGQILAFHLRLTGSLLRERSERARLRVLFEPGGWLSLVDPRRFGTVRLETASDFAASAGPDLFDEGLTADVLALRGGRSRRPLKAVILDQQVLAGVGNYLADESLWEARLSPQRPAASLSMEEWRTLLAEARAVARRALERGGASFSDYRRVDGTLGGMQETFRCYSRGGEPCLRCGTTLAKATVASRGTTFCPACQH
jgi:formamidopyrimidine-DNA glycosylase